MARDRAQRALTIVSCRERTHRVKLVRARNARIAKGKSPVSPILIHN